MRHKWFKFVCSGVISVVLLGMAFISTPAETKGKRPAKVGWTQDRIIAIVAPGSTFSTPVTFASTKNLSNVTFWWTPSIGNVLIVDPSILVSVTAVTPTTLTLRVIIPADTKRRNYNGNFWVCSNGKKLNRPLHLRIKVKHSATK
jgi:hypothetical protein